MRTVKDYTVHLDSKKRITLRGAGYQYYNVREFPNGCITLEPRILTVPDAISEETQKNMDQAMENFRLGHVSDPVDLSDFLEES